MEEKDRSGARFYNKATGEYVSSTLTMHLKFFFLNEQRVFGTVIIICIAMFFALSVFLVYHLRLVMANTTTNESFKKDDYNQRLDREFRIITELTKETEDWKPKSNDPKDQVMPILNIDNIKMPDYKNARLKKMKEFMASQNKRKKNLNENSPY